MTSNIQVFQIAYCDFFELSKAEAWNQICADFVHSVRDFMTEMQTVHYILHLVQCMQDFRHLASVLRGSVLYI